MMFDKLEKLDKLKASLKNWQYTPISVEALQGGLTNQCVKLLAVDKTNLSQATEQKGRPFIWRPLSFKSDAFGLSAKRESNTLNVLKAFNKSPNPEFLTDQGLVIEWLEGKSLSQSYKEEPDKQSLSLKLMADLHQFSAQNQLANDLSLHQFNFTECVDLYWQGIADENKNKNEQLTQRYQTYRQPNPSLIQASLKLASPQLCHFDLGLHNLIISEDEKNLDEQSIDEKGIDKKGLNKKDFDNIKIIDWEYAAISYPVLELALVILGEDLPLKSSVTEYCQLNGHLKTKSLNIKEWQQTVEDWLPHLDLMRDLWFVLNQQLDDSIR